MLFTETSPPRLLTEKYRPRCLAQLVGQSEAVASLEAYAAAPYPSAWLFEGDTGVGKTSAAFALAHELGCAVDQHEFGGLHEIASGEQTAQSVRDMLRSLWMRPFYGSGWRVLIVNECDQMSGQAETIWLDALEDIPPRCCIIFTTNNAAKLAPRFRDRCERIAFVSDVDSTRTAAQSLAVRIWQLETGRTDKPSIPAADIIEGGCLSFRRVVQAVAKQIRLSGKTLEAA